MPEGGQHEQITAEVVLHAGRFVRRPHGEEVGAEPGRLLGEALVAEAVTVAFADRDEPRELLQNALLVCPPARGVDVEGERHGRARNLSRGCDAVEQGWDGQRRDM